MTISEFNNKIAEATDINWFNSINESVQFRLTGIKISFDTVSALYGFTTKQTEGWNNLGNTIPNELNFSKNSFQTLKAQLEFFVNNFISQNSDSLKTHWSKQVKPHLQSIQNCFTYDCPETVFLVKVYQEEQGCYQGAYQYLTGNTNSITNIEYFKGALYAFEFKSKDKSTIAARADIENKSLANLKGDFQKYLSDSSRHVVEHIAEINLKYKNFSKDLEAFKKGRESEVNAWFDNSQKQFTQFSTESNSKIKELEKTYEELLRLKKPAEYWRERAVILKGEGWQALKWLSFLVIFGCISLYLLLWPTPEGMLKSFFNEDKATAIKWSIVYITFISFLVIGIRALGKVMFSSFHLSRDAEEREHLTYVYLALIKEKGVDEKDKNLIMQSLFSRADTGLLKEDSSPTMPRAVVEKIISK